MRGRELLVVNLKRTRVTAEYRRHMILPWCRIWLFRSYPRHRSRNHGGDPRVDVVAGAENVTNSSPAAACDQETLTDPASEPRLRLGDAGLRFARECCGTTHGLFPTLIFLASRKLTLLSAPKSRLGRSDLPSFSRAGGKWPAFPALETSSIACVCAGRVSFIISHPPWTPRSYLRATGRLERAR